MRKTFILQKCTLIWKIKFNWSTKNSYFYIQLRSERKKLHWWTFCISSTRIWKWLHERSEQPWLQSFGHTLSVFMPDRSWFIRPNYFAFIRRRKLLEQNQLRNWSLRHIQRWWSSCPRFWWMRASHRGIQSWHACLDSSRTDCELRPVRFERVELDTIEAATRRQEV